MERLASEQQIREQGTAQKELKGPLVDRLATPVRLLVDRFVGCRLEGLPKRILPKPLAIRLAGVVAISVMESTACRPVEPIVSSVPPVVTTEQAESMDEQIWPDFFTSLEERTKWFDGLNSKQKTAVLMYGIMGLYITRFIARGTKAIIDPRGEIKLRRLIEEDQTKQIEDSADDDSYDPEIDYIATEPKQEIPRYERDLGFLVGNTRKFIQNTSKITTEERLDALRSTIVNDPQNTRTAIGVSGALTASIIHLLDEGSIGNLDVNTNILIVSLFAALLPAFRAFDRYKEKMHLEVIQKTAASVAGSFLGINVAGLYVGSEDTTFLQLFISAVSFGVLFAYADMGTASRDFDTAMFDVLKKPEVITRYDALLKNRRLSHQARLMAEALTDGRVDEVLRKHGILNKSLTLVKKSLQEDGINPEDLSITLNQWRTNMHEAVDEFTKYVLEGEEAAGSNGRRHRKKTKTFFGGRK